MTIDAEPRFLPRPATVPFTPYGPGLTSGYTMPTKRRKNRSGGFVVFLLVLAAIGGAGYGGYRYGLDHPKEEQTSTQALLEEAAAPQATTPDAGSVTTIDTTVVSEEQFTAKFTVRPVRQDKSTEIGGIAAEMTFWTALPNSTSAVQLVRVRLAGTPLGTADAVAFGQGMVPNATTNETTFQDVAAVELVGKQEGEHVRALVFAQNDSVYAFISRSTKPDMVPEYLQLLASFQFTAAAAAGQPSQFAPSA